MYQKRPRLFIRIRFISLYICSISSENPKEMAVEFLLTFSAQRILLKVSSVVSQELALAWGFKAELTKLGDTLFILQDFLLGAADQRPHDRGNPVEKWVQKLKDVAHDADDVLDEFNYELLRRKFVLQNHMKRKVLNFLSASNPHWFRVKMGHKIRKINDSLMKLKTEADLIKLVARRDLRAGSELADRGRQTNSFPDEKVVGREDIIRNIVKELVDSSNIEKNNNLSVMAIVGMGGLGKTTLAQSVYHTPLISTTFDKRIWVCVSNPFDVDTILHQMVESVAPLKAGLENQDPMLKALIEELAGKRFLLVLDDVWNEERVKWESLMSCLSKLGSKKGSTIIITTRRAQVASIAETLPRPKVTNLTDDECWSIMKQRAWDDKYSLDADREVIGRKIAERCGGIPLAAKVLGGVLRSKTEADEWLSIQNNEIWGQLEEADNIMPILKLSFDNLKLPSLKQCFQYCSMLKKDFEIERDELVQLWMAQGLLQQPSSNQIHYEMEDTGNQYFNILLDNSLLQEVPKRYEWVDTMYTMHDLVHDLAEQVSISDILTRDFEDTRGVRHVANVSSSTLENISKDTTRRLQSIFCQDWKKEEKKVTEINFSKFKSLRTLGLSKTNIVELPSSIGKLKHLRYLDVSRTRIKALPKSIGNLFNLQTLRMQDTYLYELPREIENLKNLRYLYVDKRVKFPAGMLRGLTNLQTLAYFRVRKKMGCGIEELGDLNKLKGRLSIYNLENVRDEEEAKKAKLQEKKMIMWLRLDFYCIRESTSTMNDEKILEGLQPHSNLQSLTVDGFMGDRFPSWMMKVPLPLMNLKQLTLLSCKQCGELPVLGHLPFLEDLKIVKMESLKCMGSEMYGYDYVYEEARREMKESVVLFPVLKRLIIMDCYELSEWEEAPTTTASTKVVTVFPCLEKLTIEMCPKIGFIPIAHGMTSLRLLKIKECKGLSSIGQLDDCTSLQVLNISRCEELTSVPISQGLPCLRQLEISDCHGLLTLSMSGMDNCTSLTVSDCGNLATITCTRVLPALRKFHIRGCHNLSSLAVLEYCPSLQELHVTDCPKLEELNPVCHSLEKLDICDCPNLEELNPPDSLEMLIITNCNDLGSLPDLRSFLSLRALDISGCMGIERLPYVPVSLEVLVIDGLENLESTPISLEEHTSLRWLKIGNCWKLKSVPTGLGYLTRLENLELGPFCTELDSFPEIPVPPQLARLSLTGWDKLESLPQQLQQFNLLTELAIYDFNGVKTLPDWLGNLASLANLKICFCYNLKYLPSLEAMQRLTKLQTLEVQGCSLLRERCKKDSGEEWPKISHIPHTQIKGNWL